MGIKIIRWVGDLFFLYKKLWLKKKNKLEAYFNRKRSIVSWEMRHKKLLGQWNCTSILYELVHLKEGMKMWFTKCWSFSAHQKTFNLQNMDITRKAVSSSSPLHAHRTFPFWPKKKLKYLLPQLRGRSA